WTHLVEHLGGKVVVDGEAETVVPRVKHLVISERHVADCNVIEAGTFGSLKARDGNLGLRVKLLGYASSDAVQLHAVELAVCHAFGQQAEEVADAHGRLQNPAALEAHVAKRIVNGTNHGRRSVVRVERRAARGLVF